MSEFASSQPEVAGAFFIRRERKLARSTRWD